MKIAKTAPNALKMLWKEKIFLKPKNTQDIESELEKRGYNFTDKNLMMALRASKFLTRRGKEKNYLYVQKYPYIEEDKNGN
jgi:hypothetical protein